MALPILTKTWQFNVNNAQGALGSGAADNKTVMLNYKNAMIGFGTQPWTVVGSSNSVAAALDGVDRWVTIANIVNAAAGSPHSWIVLKQTGINSNFQVLISFDNGAAAAGQAKIAFSTAAGYTGGSTTANPTATDEVILIGTGVNWNNNVSDLAYRWSVEQSTDGQCTRLFFYAAGSLRMFACFEKGANPVGGTPGANNSGFGSWIATGTPNLATGSGTLQNAVNTATLVTFEQNVLLSFASEVDGAWDLLPAGIAGTTAGARGKLFTLQDLWIASPSLAVGDSFPSSGTTNQFLLAANNASWSIVLPWNTGAINLS